MPLAEPDPETLIPRRDQGLVAFTCIVQTIPFGQLRPQRADQRATIFARGTGCYSRVTLMSLEVPDGGRHRRIRPGKRDLAMVAVVQRGEIHASENDNEHDRRHRRA